MATIPNLFVGLANNYAPREICQAQLINPLQMNTASLVHVTSQWQTAPPPERHLLSAVS